MPVARDRTPQELNVGVSANSSSPARDAGAITALTRDLGLPAAINQLSLAILHLQQASLGAHTVFHSALALRHFLAAFAQADLRGDPALDQLANAMTAALPAIALATEGKLSIGHVIDAGLSFREFTRLIAENQHFDRLATGVLADHLDHIAILADELDALHRRQRINARGAPLARLTAIFAAAEADTGGTA